GGRTRRRANVGRISFWRRPDRSGSIPFLAPRLRSSLDQPAAGLLGGVGGEAHGDAIGALDEHLALLGIDLAGLRMGPDRFHGVLLGTKNRRGAAHVPHILIYIRRGCAFTRQNPWDG